MRNRAGLIAGASLGAGLMYFFDAARGKRRRAIMRDRARGISRRLARSVDKSTRDLANRAQGFAREVETFWKTDEPADQVLEARVHTRIGRLISHPHEVDVTARNGTVVLKGSLLEEELGRLLAGIEAVHGVAAIDNRLCVYPHPWSVPGMQNAVARTHVPRDSWPPATRLVMGVAGGTLIASGAALAGRKGLLGAAVGLSGAALAARSFTNQGITRLAGMSSGTWDVDLRKTLHLEVPVEKAFEFLANYQNFPRFMSHIKEVRSLGHNRSHWIAAGPAGIPIDWNAEVTRLEPKALIEWQSVPVSMIENAGEIRFDPQPDGTTRLHFRLRYNTPAGATGRLVARLLYADPGRAMNEDLLRLKSLLEVGKTRLRGEKITRDELTGVAKGLVPVHRHPN